MSQSNPSLLSRLYTAVGAARLAHLAALVLGVALFLLGLETLQIFHLDEPLGVGGATEMVRSEVFAVVTIAATGLGICLFSGRRRVHTLGLVGMQIVGAYAVFANVVGHFFFEATGSTLTGPVLGHGLGVLVESPEVILSEIPPVGWVVLVAGLVTVLAGPPLVARWVGQRFDGDPPEQDGGANHRLAVACLVGGLVSLFVAAIPATDLSHDVGFSREQGLHLLITTFVRSPVTVEDAEPRFDIGQLRVEPPEETGEGPENIAFIILESVRASATTPHNPELETTPHLDELAEQSIFFEQAYAVVPHTSKALIALLCGVPPRVEMEIVEAQAGGTPGRCMPTLLADHNYDSVFLQSATEEFEFRPGLVANIGYDEFIPLEQMDPTGYEEANYFGIEDDVILPYSKEWLEERDGPFMATYLTITPHHDYRAPDTYGTHDFAEDDVFNRYLNSVRYVDHFIENVLDQYRELGLYDDTLFVIVGDHGEAFGEHGREQHDNVPWQEGVHVPMMIYDGSGQLEPREVEKTTSHIDLAPTIFELMDFDLEGGDYPGYSLSELDPERYAFFSCWYDDQCAGFVQQGLKYIHHYGHRPDEMFDVIEDPREQHNLLDEDDVDALGDRNPVTRLFEWIESVDAAYRRHIREVLNRRVLADHDGFANSLEATIPGTLSLISWEWDETVEEGADLVVSLAVQREFGRDDDVEFIVAFPRGRTTSHTPMRGLYPSLFWQQGQILVDRIPASVFEGDETPERIWLTIEDEKFEFSEIFEEK